VQPPHRYAVGTVGVTSSVDAGTVTETDVMAFLDDVSPAITVDRTTNCMPGSTVGATQSTDAVAYRNDRVVLRTSASKSSFWPLFPSPPSSLFSNGTRPWTWAKA
jgi:hypothetical protein